MAEKKERFVKTWSDGIFGSNEIWVDTQTGVNYFFHATGNAGGLTPMLNRDGTPVVTPIPLNNDE